MAGKEVSELNACFTWKALYTSWVIPWYHVWLSRMDPNGTSMIFSLVFVSYPNDMVCHYFIRIQVGHWRQLPPPLVRHLRHPTGEIFSRFAPSSGGFPLSEERLNSKTKTKWPQGTMIGIANINEICICICIYIYIHIYHMYYVSYVHIYTYKGVNTISV